MFHPAVCLPAVAFVLIATPALAQNPAASSGSTPAPHPFTLGIAAASTANDRPPAYPTGAASTRETSEAVPAANQAADRLRATSRDLNGPAAR